MLQYILTTVLREFKQSQKYVLLWLVLFLIINDFPTQERLSFSNYHHACKLFILSSRWGIREGELISKFAVYLTHFSNQSTIKHHEIWRDTELWAEYFWGIVFDCHDFETQSYIQ